MIIRFDKHLAVTSQLHILASCLEDETKKHSMRTTLYTYLYEFFVLLTHVHLESHLFIHSHKLIHKQGLSIQNTRA